MRRLLTMATLALGAAPLAVEAASLGLATESAPVFAGLFDGGYGADEVSGFLDGGTSAPAEDAFVSGGLDAQILADGSIGGFGGVLGLYGSVVTIESELLSGFGWVFGAGADADTLEFLFEDATGELGERVLVTLTGEFGVDEADFFANGFSGVYAASVAPVAATGVVPLPASALLLFSALGAMALRRRG